MMDLDQLQSVRDRERQTDKLQQLRESFYADAADLVAELREERDRAAAGADDPFDDPRVSRLSDQINTAEQTVEAIYEKRVGKLVKAASFAAADLPAETEGMTAEEQDLFDALVADIRANRERVLDVLAGEAEPATESAPAADEAGVPTGDEPPGPDDERSGPGDATPAGDIDGTAGGEADATAPADVDASSLMGGPDDQPPPSPPPQDAAADDGTPAAPSGDSADPDGAEERELSGSAGADGPREGEPEGSAAARAEDDAAAPAATPGDGAPPGDQAGEPPGDGEIERTTVRITADVGEIFGVDERAYHLEADQVVTLPAANAEPLLEQDAAERLD